MEISVSLTLKDLLESLHAVFLLFFFFPPPPEPVLLICLMTGTPLLLTCLEVSVTVPL